MWISRPANLKVKGADGKEVDLSQVTSSSKAETRVYEVIKDSDEMRGVLQLETTCVQSVTVLKYTLILSKHALSDEPETRMLTCKNCGNGWREY